MNFPEIIRNKYFSKKLLNIVELVLGVIELKSPSSQINLHKPKFE